MTVASLILSQVCDLAADGKQRWSWTIGGHGNGRDVFFFFFKSFSGFLRFSLGFLEFFFFFFFFFKFLFLSSSYLYSRDSSGVFEGQPTEESERCALAGGEVGSNALCEYLGDDHYHLLRFFSFWRPFFLVLKDNQTLTSSRLNFQTFCLVGFPTKND